MGITHNYLFDPLLEKCEIELKRFELLCDEIFNELRGIKNELQISQTQNSQISSSNEETSTVGRIGYFQSSLTEKSVYLLIDYYGSSKRLNLNLTKMQSYTLFPGQVVAVKGISTKTDIFAYEMVTSVQQTFPKTIILEKELSFAIACGPFTDKDNMDYLPLKHFLRAISANPPDVLIVIGPIIDANHNFIVTRKLNEDVMELFDKLINGIKSAVSKNTQIIILSSPRDVLSKVYPTFPYAKSSGNIRFMPDPSIISVNDVTIGMTSVDCLSHILEKELIKNPALDKIKRSVNYLFGQKSFYPLFPVHNDVNIDSGLADKFVNLNLIPNIMILPGTMNCFVRVNISFKCVTSLF